ncbi:uncharacterized protein LOC9656710 isoform X1 [Selaginella moellendorffii]|uniref:uncharacterized protein LOC9656710 isoform X1 n=1 Tax=Selaginella moellendorffii TaxID=88036 RepID=UPI000D1C3F80|nr:uncharacterized protein LOC9656710 isoform X1 [Selaginella moellendorffii]|eukprot:XP_024516803.1 uncharacterized protein LOC9656710 isoform X1 [Selaginella moellendorffii]
MKTKLCSSKLALDAARAALDGGLDVLEVTMTTPGASKVIATLVHEYPSALIGAGTVLSLDQAEEAKASGATFLLSPITVKELVEIHSVGPVLFVPGAMTPTEVYTAHSYGAHIVKIYPTDLAGGAKYVRSLRKLLAHIPMIASQGITLDDPALLGCRSLGSGSLGRNLRLKLTVKLLFRENHAASLGSGERSWKECAVKDLAQRILVGKKIPSKSERLREERIANFWKEFPRSIERAFHSQANKGKRMKKRRIK